MLVRPWIPAAVALLALGGCGTGAHRPRDDAGQDAGADAGRDGASRDAASDEAEDEGADADSPASAGPLTLVVASVEIVDDRICDLDEDGTDDNAVADLGEPGSSMFALMLNSGIQGAIDQGLRIAMHMPWVDDLATPDDPEVLVIAFEARDTDRPRNGSDDFSGDEELYADTSCLDDCGEPEHFFGSGRIRGGELAAGSGSFPMSAGATHVARGAEVIGTLEPGGSGGSLLVCGYLLARELGREEVGAAAGDLNTLELFLVGGAGVGYPAIPGIAPDLDLDHDGVERFLTGDGGHIESCIDGDGTPIPGRDCWDSDRIADAFSVTYRVVGVPARFAGREPGWDRHLADACPSGPPGESLFDPR